MIKPDMPQQETGSTCAGWIKRNLVLVLGIVLPVLMMLAFFVMAQLPQKMADPPQYDMVFSVDHYNDVGKVPVEAMFVVKDGVLKAQYTRRQNDTYGTQWKRLYLYEAKTQTIRRLEFGLPADIDSIETIHEETVAATKDMKLDTRTHAPDGYELYNDYHGGGLIRGVFGGYRNNNRTVLRKDGGAGFPLLIEGKAPYYYNVDFLGWVIP